MESIKLDIFLSCSFQRKDSVIVSLVRSICTALDLTCINVDKGYAQIPPNKASEYISKVPALIAIATRRDRIRSGVYAMPPAVRDELFMAFDKKPILLIVENGVRIDGFLNNIGTYLTFSKDTIWTVTFIQKLIASIHNFKMDVLGPTGFGTFPYSKDYSTETFQALIELEKSNQGFVWTSSFTRRIRFLNEFKAPLKVVFWPDKLPVGKIVGEVRYKIKYESGSQDFKLKTTEIKNPTAVLELSIGIKPQPQQGDYIQYTLFCTSKHLFPIYAEDTSITIDINNRQYSATAGVIRSTPTDTLKLRYKFPKEYGLDSRNISRLAATYATTIDRIDEGEMERIDWSIESFGGNILVSLSIDKPVLGRFYGIAWIPPNRRKSMSRNRPAKASRSR